MKRAAGLGVALSMLAWATVSAVDQWPRFRGLQAGVYRGLDEVLDFYRSFLDTFERVEVRPDRFIESGDLVVVPNSAQIRGRDGIATVARSALVFDLLVFDLRDGRITRIRLHQETREALEAVGLQE